MLRISILSFFFCFATLAQILADELLIPTKASASLKAELSKKVKSFVCYRLNTNYLERLKKNQADIWSLSLELPNGQTKSIELAKRDILTSNFRIKTSGGAKWNSTSFQPIHYQGKVENETSSVAAFSMTESEVSGIFSFGTGNYNLVKIRKPGVDLYALFNDRDILEANPFECHAEKLDSYLKPLVQAPKEKLGGGDQCRQVGLYLECDYQMFTDNGQSVSNTVNFATSLFNVVSAMYAQAGIVLRLSEMMVHNQPDNYPSATSQEALFAFSDSVAIRPPFQGNLAHLLSTIPNANGGIAFLDVLCQTGTGYSNIYTSFLPLPYYSWNVNVVTHELGHNFGSPHTQNCGWEISPGVFGMIDSCYIPEGSCYEGPRIATIGTQMSYCHLMNLGIDMSKGFGPLPGELILNRFHNASCLQGGVELPPLFISKSDTFCAGSAVNLSVTQVQGATYLWSGPDGFSSNLASPTISNISPSKAGDYTVVVTKDQCSSSALRTRVAVNCVYALPQTSYNICLPGSFTVDYLSTVTPLAGNIFTVQLSDANGSFQTPTNLGSLTSTQARGSIQASLPPGFVPDTGYRVRITTSNPSTTGEPSNQRLIFAAQPEAPTAADVRSCLSGVFTLTASSPWKTYWYGQPHAQTPLGTGNSFTTPLLSSTTSYWVESRSEQKEQVGPAVQFGIDDTLSVNNTYHGLYIKVKKQVVVDSITVYPSGAGVLRFNVKDSANTFYYKSLAISVQGNMQGEKIKVGLEFSPGIYRIDAEGSTVPKLLRLNGFNSYPLISNGLDIIGPTVNTRYYFFFDWKTRTVGCPSKRREVKAIVLGTPTPPTTTGSSNCGPSSLTLQAAGAQPDESYAWYTSSTGSSAIPGQVSGSYITPLLSSSSTYYVSILNSGNCESNRVPVTASILSAPPTPSLTLAGGYLVASPDTIFSWFKNNTLLGVFGDSLNYSSFGDGFYFVVYKRSNGCEAHSDTLLVTEKLPKTSGSDGFRIFPNPGEGLFTILANENSPFQIVCFDGLGRELIKTTVLPGHSIDLRSYPSGIYALKIENKKEHLLIRIRKE